MDVHKYGLAPKGTSVVLYRNHDIRKVTCCLVDDSLHLELEVDREFCHSFFLFEIPNCTCIYI